jgi:sec-independent protein translocase protein TatB
MFGIGTGELLLLLLIALIVLGPERMPKLARDLGRAMAEFRKTSDELKNEFLNADKFLEESTKPAITAPKGAPEPALTEAAVATDVPVAPDVPVTPSEPDETLFDREAREARERLRDPERAERAKAEGWVIPTDEAGTSDRSG